MASSLAIPKLFSVTNLTIVVTGGGTGIGRSIATGFAINGAKVFIVGRRANVLGKAAEDINKEVDCLVNCAGISIQPKEKINDQNNVSEVQRMLESVDDDDMSLLHKVNVAGPMFCTGAFLPLLQKAKDPNVINISSIAALGLHKKIPPLTYSVSKGGTSVLSRQLASRLIPLRIRVNTINPGLFISQMSLNPDGTYIPTVQAAIPHIPVGHIGTPEEIAGVCIMLTSPAGSYLNNADITVDGGRLMTTSSDA